MSDNVAAEYGDIMAARAWGLVYQKLGRESQKYGYTCIEARKPENKTLNRYRDVNPYDHSRVVLQRGSHHYINANLVKMDQAGRKYILTQGPLPDTVGHFWLMVWEQKSEAILMLNKVMEKNEIKCHMYWPDGIGEAHKMQLNDVGLTVELISTENFNYYSVRMMRLFDTETNISRDIIQFHYTTWPDFGVPSSPNAFLDFLKRVRDSGALKPEAGPAIVHCSAGIGRSGTFCLVDACLVLIEQGVEQINVQNILLEMRRDRMGLIQTPDQLQFVYAAIIEGKKRLSPDWVPSAEPVGPEEEGEELPPPPPPRCASLQPPYQPSLPREPSVSQSESDGDSQPDYDDDDEDDDDTTSSSSVDLFYPAHLSPPTFSTPDVIAIDRILQEVPQKEEVKKASEFPQEVTNLYVPFAIAICIGTISLIYAFYRA